MVLNDGLDFHEISSTAAEMQMNELKQSNATEVAKLLHISPSVMGGTATRNDIESLARLAAIPLMNVIQCALNRDLLLESEKGKLYFSFDTKELLKGDMATRYAAYKTALDGNFMQIDEVRYAEDLEPLGLTWVKLGLNDVLYDPKTKQIYTPNTDKTAKMGADPVKKEEEPDENRDPN
jgi:HK97 family phage portal protein